jgi:hypothetical protein
MKLHATLRRSRQRSAPPLPDGALVLRLAYKSLATGRVSLSPNHRSRLAKRSSFVTRFLIGYARLETSVTPMPSMRNRFLFGSKTHIVLTISSLRHPRIAAHESGASSAPTHGIIMLSWARRGSLTPSPDAQPAAGNRRGTKPASAYGHLTLRH